MLYLLKEITNYAEKCFLRPEWWGIGALINSTKQLERSMNKGVNRDGAQKPQQGTGAPWHAPVYMAYFENCSIMIKKRERLGDGIRVMPRHLLLQQLWRDKIIR
jgi:hypothetical protein